MFGQRGFGGLTEMLSATECQGEGKENRTVTESPSEVPKTIGHREKVCGEQMGCIFDDNYY